MPRKDIATELDLESDPRATNLTDAERELAGLPPAELGTTKTRKPSRGVGEQLVDAYRLLHNGETPKEVSYIWTDGRDEGMGWELKINGAKILEDDTTIIYPTQSEAARAYITLVAGTIAKRAAEAQQEATRWARERRNLGAAARKGA